MLYHASSSSSLGEKNAHFPYFKEIQTHTHTHTHTHILALPIERAYRSSRHGSAEMYPTRNHEVVGSILRLSQWVVVWVVDVAWILSCFGYSVGWWLQLQFNP